MERLINILFCILLLIYVLKNVSETFESINSNDMNTQKLGVLNLPNIPEIIIPEKLPDCTVPIDFKYGYNENYIWNDGESVNIDVLRQVSRNYLLYNNKDRFQLRAVRFTESNILDGDKGYLLQLVLVHSNPRGVCNFDIIIPLSFSKNNELHIITKDEIPQYKSGGKEFGNIVKQNLEEISEFLKKTRFRKYDINKNQHLLITDPMNFSVEIGMEILNKMKTREDELNNQETWLDKDFMEI